MYSALELSKYIVTKCINDGKPISNLQLQKILYYIQRVFLKQGEPAFSDTIEAWQFGPVVPNVYYYYCGFGAMPISILEKAPDLPEKDTMEINEIVEDKRTPFPWDLVNETHKPGGAWDRIYANGRGNHQEIPVDLIRKVG